MPEGEIVCAMPDNAILPDTAKWTSPTVAYTSDRLNLIQPIPRRGKPEVYYISPRAILFGDR